MSGTQIITQPRPILKKSPARTIKKPVFFTPSLSVDSDDSECDLTTQYNDSKKTENTIESSELNDKFIELDRFQISRLGSKKSPIKSNKRKSLSSLYIFHSTEINKEIIKKLITSTDNFLDEFKQKILKTTSHCDKDLLKTYADEFLPKLKDFITGDENNLERLYDRMHMFEVGATLSDPTFYELEKYRKENQLKLKQTSSTGKIDKKTLEKSLGIFAIENKQDDEIIAGSLPARSFFDSYDKELKNKEKILLKTMRSKSIKTSNEENLLFSQAAANKSVKDKNKCIVSTATSTKKMVRFADAFGLDLENVKIITNNSFVDAFSYAQNETTKEVKNKTFSSNEDVTLKCVSKPFLVLIPLFALKKPTLDSIIKLDDFIFDYENKVIKCVIRVKNLSYNKRIFARITFNNWKKYNDLDAIYVKSESSSINKTHSTSLHSNDYFAFCIIIPEKNHVTTTTTTTTTATTELKHSAIEECTLRIEFALCYEENGNTYWDNNSGENYKFQCFYNIN